MPATNNRFYMNLSCRSRPGIISAISTCLYERDCDIIECAQFVDHDGEHFFLRMAFDAPDAIGSEAALIKELQPIADRFAMTLTLRDALRRAKILIMVSKFGHCLNDLLYRHSISALPIDIVGVVSNHDAFRSQVEAHGIPYHHLPVSPSNKREQEIRLMEIVEASDVELVILARYMQVLSQDLCTRMAGRIINIHHSFLPSFKGAKPYHQAYKRGVKLIGATAHYVTDDLDEGPIIEQEVARVDHSMSPDELVAIGRDVENVVLARAIRLHIEARVMLHDHRAIVLR